MSGLRERDELGNYEGLVVVALTALSSTHEARSRTFMLAGEVHRLRRALGVNAEELEEVFQQIDETIRGLDECLNRIRESTSFLG